MKGVMMDHFHEDNSHAMTIFYGYKAMLNQTKAKCVNEREQKINQEHISLVN